MMLPSIFGAEQSINEPLSALAVLTGRHREIKHPRHQIYYNRPKSGPTASQRYSGNGVLLYLLVRVVFYTLLALALCLFSEFFRFVVVLVPRTATTRRVRIVLPLFLKFNMRLRLHKRV